MSSEPGPFERGTIGSGAVLLATDQQLFSAIDALLDGTARVAPGRDGWLADGVPLLSRGDAWILPYFWQPADANIDEAERKRLRERSGELWNSIGGWCWYHRGDPIGIDLPSEAGSGLPTGYAKELVRTGARGADWWSAGDRAIVRVVHGDPVPAPITAMAVHVVPKHWAWYDRRRPGGLWRVTEMRPTDLAWSWADVVALARQDETGAPGDVRETGRRDG